MFSYSFLLGVQKPEELNPSLFIPLVHGECFPTKLVRFFHFGVTPYVESAKTQLKPMMEAGDAGEKNLELKLMEKSNQCDAKQEYFA